MRISKTRLLKYLWEEEEEELEATCSLIPFSHHINYHTPVKGDVLVCFYSLICV